MDDSREDDLPPELNLLADLLWEQAQGAPPLEEDKVWWMINSQMWENEV